jgi:dihydrofolate reductase
MLISLVVAVSENGIIGASGAMPWHLSSDLKHFKQTTLGKPVVMGRKTFEAIGRPLPGRDNIIVSRKQDYLVEGAVVAPDVPQALALGRRYAERLGVVEICVIGGGEIYRQTLDVADRIYLTEVHMRVDGDTGFPALDRDEWSETSRRRYAAGERDSSEFSIVIYDRARPRGRER